MKISRKADTPYRVTAELSPMETLALRAALGEACGGFHIPDFETRIGGTRDEAEQLFKKMDRLASDRQNEVGLTMKEVHLLRKAHQETLRELGPEEYETRTGVDFALGQALLEQFAEALGPDESQG